VDIVPAVGDPVVVDTGQREDIVPPADIVLAVVDIAPAVDTVRWEEPAGKAAVTGTAAPVRMQAPKPRLPEKRVAPKQLLIYCARL
jgi:hypothetical protein